MSLFIVVWSCGGGSIIFGAKHDHRRGRRMEGSMKRERNSGCYLFVQLEKKLRLVPGGPGPILGASPGDDTSCDGSGRSICGDCGGCVALQYA